MVQRLRNDRSSAGFGRPQAQALGLALVFGLAGLSGVVQARVHHPHGVMVPRAEAEARPRGPVNAMRPDAVKEAAHLKALSFVPVNAAEVGLDPARLDEARRAVQAEARRGAFPGGALAIGRRGQPVMLDGVGSVYWGGPAVDPEHTVYDIASLSKVVGTTTAVMLLVEDGKMDLDAPVARYLPEFQGDGKGRVTVRHLLTHTSGLPAWADLYGLSPEAAQKRAIATPLRWGAGAKVEYTDVGFVVLFAAAERAAGEPIPQLLERRVFAPLGMTDTRYLPGEGCAECAPTWRKADGTMVRGVVHDPIARQLGGVAGNAGLFSTAEDLGRFAAMLANGGELDGVRVLREETVRKFTERQPDAGTRALGWDTPERDGTGAAGRKISAHAFGHTGFTGTSLWVDPDRGTWTVLLTNRVYKPKAANKIQALRRKVNDHVAEAAE